MIAKRAWKLFSTGMSVYFFYLKMKEVQLLKNQFYSQLAPSEQEIWKKYFGDPTVVPAVVNAIPPQVKS